MQEPRTVLCCEWNNKGKRILKTCVWTVSTKFRKQRWLCHNDNQDGI